MEWSVPPRRGNACEVWDDREWVMELLTTSLLSTSAQREIPGSGRERIRVVLSIHRLCSTCGGGGNKSTLPFSEVTLGRNGSDAQGCLAEAGKRFLITASRFYYCGGKMCSLETNGSFPSTGSDMFICLRQKKKTTTQQLDCGKHCGAIWEIWSLCGRSPLF